MLCNSLLVMGWQKVRNFSVRFNALRYLWLKSSSTSSLLRVNGNRLSSATLMLSILSNQFNIAWKSLNMSRREGQFLSPLSQGLSLPD